MKTNIPDGINKTIGGGPSGGIEKQIRDWRDVPSLQHVVLAHFRAAEWKPITGDGGTVI